MAIYVIVALVAVAVTLLVSIPVTANLSVKKKTEKDAETIGTAEVKARSIIDEALKTAETKKREALWRSRKSPLRQKMNLRRRPERDAMNFRSMRNVFYQKKKPLIRKQML